LSADQISPNRQSQIYATAAWLHPGAAEFRDLYASALLREGRRAQGLKEVGASVALAPSLTRHFYLHERILPWLSADEKSAIEAGFRQAVERGDLLAPENLAQFYERTGQRLAQAQFLAERANRETDTHAKMAWTLKAAESFAAAEKRAQAAELWRQAVALEPRDARPYQALALAVYAPQGQRERIAAVIAEGVKNNSEALPLYLSLAQAMQQIGAADEVKNGLRQASESIRAAAARGENVLPLWLKLADTANKITALDDERFALEQAAELQPAKTDTLARLGNLYLRMHQNDHAAQILRRLIKLQPQAAQAYFQLAQAEEARYGYAAADDAYSRAAELAPDNKEFQGRRDEFRQKLAAALQLDGKK
jgi:tetratricopeptide (TPR) repeat protein